MCCINNCDCRFARICIVSYSYILAILKSIRNDRLETYRVYRDTVWPENLTGIKFDEIVSKLHNKNMTDFNLTKCAVRRHIV